MELFRGQSERASESSTTGEFKKIGTRAEKTQDPRTLHDKSFEAKRDKGGEGAEKRLDE
jgi:hypothetical protein